MTRRHGDASAAQRKMRRPPSPSMLRTTLLLMSLFAADTHCWSTLITSNSSPQHQNRDPQPVKNHNLPEKEIRRNMPLHANETYKQLWRNKHKSLFLAPSPSAKRKFPSRLQYDGFVCCQVQTFESMLGWSLITRAMVTENLLYSKEACS